MVIAICIKVIPIKLSNTSIIIRRLYKLQISNDVLLKNRIPFFLNYVKQIRVSSCWLNLNDTTEVSVPLMATFALEVSLPATFEALHT